MFLCIGGENAGDGGDAVWVVLAPSTYLHPGPRLQPGYCEE